MQVAGFYPPPPEAGVPGDIPGMELAGEVVESRAPVPRFEPGTRVMAIVAGAAQAELAVVDERQLMPVPDGIDWVEAGGFPEVFATAYDALVGQARLRSGQRLLVNGAGGGVGTAAVQLGSVLGAEVTASVRNEKNRAGVEALGAKRAVAPDEAFEHGPFDVVLELVGGPNLADNVKSLAPWGTIVVIGVSAGTDAAFDLRRLMTIRGTVRASTLRYRTPEEKALLARDSKPASSPSSPTPASVSRSTPSSPSPRSPPPTSASAPAATSARSSCAALSGESSDQAVELSASTVMSAPSTAANTSGSSLPIRLSSRRRETARIARGIAALSASIPAVGDTGGRRLDGALELESGTTTTSSSSTPTKSSSAEMTIAGRFLPGSPRRAAPSETSQTSPRRGGSQSTPSPKTVAHSRSSASTSSLPASARVAWRSERRASTRWARRANSVRRDDTETPRSLA